MGNLNLRNCHSFGNIYWWLAINSNPGSKFYKIRPVHGFAAQATSAMVILTASLLGGPVSTTQVVSTSIMGVGAAERMSKVRWGVAGEIMSAWLFTIPATMPCLAAWHLLAYICCYSCNYQIILGFVMTVLLLLLIALAIVFDFLMGLMIQVISLPP